jgi:hypothetical protein
MTLHVFLFLLLFVLMFSLVRLCSLCGPHDGPAQSAAAKRAPIHRLLKPRSPHDCPICRFSCAHSSVVGPVPPTVRPWREVKSRRGVPKRVNTECMTFRHRHSRRSRLIEIAEIEKEKAEVREGDERKIRWKRDPVSECF